MLSRRTPHFAHPPSHSSPVGSRPLHADDEPWISRAQDPAPRSPELMQLIDTTWSTASQRPHLTPSASRVNSPYHAAFTSFVSTVLHHAEVATSTILVALVCTTRARPHLSITLEHVCVGALILASTHERLPPQECALRPLNCDSHVTSLSFLQFQNVSAMDLSMNTSNCNFDNNNFIQTKSPDLHVLHKEAARALPDILNF
ncbi:hypothetical protein B0H11DRAFT_2248640 [Mycena galericulata]|nr:hypothetical protein B0H11DRAFT_2248640 [Mycena galericulata]